MGEHRGSMGGASREQEEAVLVIRPSFFSSSHSIIDVSLKENK